jgi:hypothetical protein
MANKKKGIPLGKKPYSVAKSAIEMYHGTKKKKSILGDKIRK